MSFDVEQHVRYRIANAPVNPYPFAHFFVEEVFPPDAYRELLEALPDTAAYTPIAETGTVTGAYDERFVFDVQARAGEPGPWGALAAWMSAPSFSEFIVRKFRGAIAERFGGTTQLGLRTDLRLVRDFSTYAIAPHTDTGSKLVSLLYYLPPDRAMRHLGTSIYLPRDPALRSDGAKHLAREDFHRVASMPFVPNSLFAFVRADFSFHGVEPIADAAIERDLLLYNVYATRVAGPASGA